MEFVKLLENKKVEIEDLRTQLSKFEMELGSVKEKSPPRWSGDVKELNKFVRDLGEWIKSPKVKRSKDLIEKLKKYANDNRSLKGLGEDYLISILAILENAVTVLSEIENESLKVNASMRILDKLQGEEDFNNLIQDIRNYWQSFKEFEEKGTQNEFLETVKENMLTSLVEPVSFSPERITEAENIVEKASNAVELLVNYDVSIQAYIKTYEVSKSIDKVWEEADTVRKLLEDTDFQITEEVENPFREMKEILNMRDEYIRKENLSEISNGLEKIKEKIGEWRGKVKEKFDNEYRKTKDLIEFAEFEDEIEELSDEFKEKIKKSSNVNDIYTPYKKFQEIKRDAINKLEGQFSEDERKIIENLNVADELVDNMGKDFWKALKSLRDKRLIKIVIRRGG